VRAVVDGFAFRVNDDPDAIYFDEGYSGQICDRR
jgi:hypothetical protein